jgi:hypothetical protein
MDNIRLFAHLNSPILIINQSKLRLHIGFGYGVFILDPFHNVKETRRRSGVFVQEPYIITIWDM